MLRNQPAVVHVEFDEVDQQQQPSTIWGLCANSASKNMVWFPCSKSGCLYDSLTLTPGPWAVKWHFWDGPATLWHQTRISSHFNIQSQTFQCILKWTSPWIEFRMEITRIYHWSLWQGPLTFHSTNSRESKKPLTSQQFTTTEYKDKSQQFVSCYVTTFWPKNGRLNCLFRGSC